MTARDSRSPMPCGTWPSPIAAADLARASISLNYVQSTQGEVYWIESRPAEGGRYVLMQAGAAGEPRQLTPTGFNVRTRVHEYGGLPYLASGETVYFCHFDDQRLYVQRGSSTPVPQTREGYRYADFALDSAGARLFAVREDHTGSGEPRNAIVCRAAAGGEDALLFGDSDFVAYPRVSPDGGRIAWIAWNHPDMPWDSTTLYVAELASGALATVTAIAGGAGESVMEPRWGADGTLYFLSDRSDWWNLYRARAGRVERVLALAADFATPLWTLGQSNYALTGDGRAIARYGVDAHDRLGLIELDSGRLTELEVPFSGISNLALLDSRTALAIAATPVEDAALVRIDLASGRYRVLRSSGSLSVPAGYISVPEPMAYPTLDDRTAHAFYYPPRNPQYSIPAQEKPPLIVKVHGGPTSHSKPEFALAAQFWTSRGFALLDVNHRGSSGFGRAYREQLNGNWGVVDVGDAVAAVRYLVAAGRVDPRRVAIRGGSAGGFTVLAALAFHDVFSAGANYYGVSDLEALAQDTHKFESRYLDRLIAPLPQGRAVYEARAPIRHLEHFRAPLITFQGSEDKVVPPGQSRAIVEALRGRGVTAEYLEFEGEQHGFRRAENIVRALEAELAFYGRVFGFNPAAADAGSRGA